MSSSQSIWKTFVGNKKTFFCAAAIALIVAAVVSISTPTTYKSQEMLAVEWAAPMNVLVGAKEYADDILSHKQTPPIANDPYSYTKILTSPQLVDTIKHAVVTESDGEVKTLEQHVSECYTYPWWVNGSKHSVEDIIHRRLKNEIKLKTGLITVQYEDEDAAVSSAIASRMTTFLDGFFRQMNADRVKAEADYYRRQVSELKRAYEESERKYAAYYDSHLDVSTQSGQNELEYLRDESEKRYGEYSKACVMLKRAEMRQQQQLLVSSRLKTMPTFKSGGARAWVVNSAVALFYALLFVAWWVLLRERINEKRKDKD